MGKGQYVELLQNNDFKMAINVKQEYVDLFKYYYYVGGMPEVVLNFSKNKDFNEAREIQQRIVAPETILNYLKACEEDYLLYRLKSQDVNGKKCLR